MGVDMSYQQRVAVSFAGCVVMIIGLYVPWYSLDFSPPRGSIVIDGRRYAAFASSINGFSGAGTQPTDTLRTTVLILTVLAAVSLIGLIPALEGLFEPLYDHVVEWLKAAVHVIQSLGWIGFLLLVLALGKQGFPTRFYHELGSTKQAATASQYVHFHYAWGVWVLLLGIAIASVTLWKKIGVLLAVLAGGTVVLACTHSAWLGPFYSLMFA